jgi:hypothetical protein
LNKRVSFQALSPLMEEILSKGGSVSFIVTGDSMRPMLRHRRDKVCIEKPRENPLRKYDIPLFIREDGKYILHRIVSVKRSAYVVIGDNQYAKEYPVLPSQVLGVVRGFWRNGKYISCDDFRYRLYCRLWVMIYPARWLYYYGKKLLNRGICLLRATKERKDEG